MGLKESPPSRVEWIEIPYKGTVESVELSPPSRVEWIEIASNCTITFVSAVSAFAGGVD